MQTQAFVQQANQGANQVFQADPQTVQAMQQCKQAIHHVCRQHMHKRVQVQTMQGQVHTGTLVGFDDHYVYLDVSSPGVPDARYPFFPPAAYNPYSAAVLPLVLFNLLTISLLY